MMAMPRCWYSFGNGDLGLGGNFLFGSPHNTLCLYKDHWLAIWAMC